MTGEGQALNFGHPGAKLAMLAMAMPANGVIVALTLFLVWR
jgi:hypothetical protein